MVNYLFEKVNDLARIWCLSNLIQVLQSILQRVSHLIHKNKHTTAALRFFLFFFVLDWKTTLNKALNAVIFRPLLPVSETVLKCSMQYANKC